MPADVHLLLKSSDFVLHDLTQPFKVESKWTHPRVMIKLNIILQDCEDHVINSEPVKYDLVLRKWIEINPANEFRCFVRNKILIGM